MNVFLPDRLRRTKFDRLFSIELNDFDVERLLPTLFNLVITKGRNRTSGRNEQLSVDECASRLARHPSFSGFDGDAERAILAQWLRATALKVGRAGRGKVTEKIEFVVPETLLTYKTGLPKPSSRQRNVPRFLYSALCRATGLATENERRSLLQRWFRETFGAGLSISEGAPFDGRYDEATDVDLNVLLTMRALEVFDLGEIAAVEATEPDPLLKVQASQAGEDALLLLRGYRDRVPAKFLARMLMAVINLDLFVYTLRLMKAVDRLCETGRLPSEEDSEEPRPEIYLDVTGERGGRSDGLARACVERDLEGLGRFFENNLRLLMLDRMREVSSRLQDVVGASPIEGGRYFEALLAAEGSEEVRARAEAELDAVLEESRRKASSDGERSDFDREYSEFVRAKTAPASLHRLLCDGLRKQAVQNYAKWFRGVGGLNRPYGLIVGNDRGPRNWRYTLREELLRTLVFLAAVEPSRNDLTRATPSPDLNINDFLEWAERRFGILIDRPPREHDSAAAREAAAENFGSFKLRLRQCGFFRGLSDDFNVQRLELPLAKFRTEEAVS